MTLSGNGGYVKKACESEDFVNEAAVPEPLDESMTLREEEKPKEEAGEVESEVVARPLLPPPIDEERSCKWCYVGDACMLFRRVRSILSVLIHTVLLTCSPLLPSGDRRRARNLRRRRGSPSNLVRRTNRSSLGPPFGILQELGAAH